MVNKDDHLAVKCRKSQHTSMSVMREKTHRYNVNKPSVLRNNWSIITHITVRNNESRAQSSYMLEAFACNCGSNYCRPD